MSLREREIFPCAKRKTDVKVKNKFESNSLAKCEKAQEARQTALLNLFVSIISDSVYNKLRIEEKLGYLVECETRLIHGVGFYVCVVSSDYNPCHLVRRIYKFMNGIRLEGLFDKMFKDFKNGVSSKLPHDSGKTKWSEIVRESCIFDFYSEEKKELSLITKNDLIEWYKRYVRLSSPKCCSFVVSIWGCNTKNGLEKVKILRLRRKMKRFSESGEFHRSRDEHIITYASCKKNGILLQANESKTDTELCRGKKLCVIKKAMDCRDGGYTGTAFINKSSGNPKSWITVAEQRIEKVKIEAARPSWPTI
ncbi:Metalloenzyme LuxS/M16 peptidase-like [Arabidopsis suecica]|uniref:Metalloenzyme LuxS/M16 peptidase-like n=1 Tax=Arabidopsis suecica TaxID=45249 RepID=A0A8T2D5F6_ARASU|nr:Metalloenzyme LuxS/M16 peptidase-like [Arabidopsis suecica]